MLANPGGQERTDEEYRVLLRRAGFKLERIIPTTTPFKILECQPSSDPGAVEQVHQPVDADG
jgi:hypothetical protein